MDGLNKTDPLYIQAVTHSDAGEWREAEQAFVELRKKYPQSEVVPLNLGNIYYSMGRLEDGAKEYRKAIELKKDSGNAYYKLGVCLFRLGRLREALEAFEQVLALRSQSHAMASYFLGLINFLMGRDEAAERSFSQLRGISRESLIANFFLAQLKLKEQKYQDALALLKELLDQSPELAEGHYMMGQAYYGLHQNIEAIKAYQRALELSPEDARIKSKLTLLTEMEW